MADDKKSGESNTGVDRDKFIFAILGGLLIFIILGNLFRTNKVLNYFYDPDNRGEDSEEISTGFLYPKNLRLGDEIVNKKIAQIRQAPGGALIGNQDKRVSGRIIEGPVSRFDLDWWRIDYPTAPDGWVESGSFTNKIFVFYVLNIIPITLEFLRPFFVLLAIIMAAMIILLSLKMADLKRLSKMKDEAKNDQKSIVLDDISEEDIQSEIIDDLPVPNLPIGENPKTEDVSDRRWENIQSLIRSYNSNDWKQAIIEADVILDEMLDKMNYKGQTIGEKLKTVEASDFMTLNQAWEAHKFRNRIAHGNKYVLTKDEAQRVIDLYEEVFNEFFYI